jgi:hypothetical protein
MLKILNLPLRSNLFPVFGKKNGRKNGFKLGRSYSASGLSSWVMAFLTALDKQLLKSLFFCHILYTENFFETNDLCSFRGLQEIAKHSTLKNVNCFILKLLL